jgi:hypothetical protein
MKIGDHTLALLGRLDNSDQIVVAETSLVQNLEKNTINENNQSKMIIPILHNTKQVKY